MKANGNIIYKVTREVDRPTIIGCSNWPLAGQKLNDLRDALGIDTDTTPARVQISGTHQDYRVTDNGYLIPYYPTSRFYDSEARQEIGAGEPISRRNEALMIARARSFTINAQPELSVPRSKASIDESIGEFSQMPDNTYKQQALKAGQFKMIVGAIVSRLETLGRIITQGNGYGIQIEYADIRNADSIPAARIDFLKREFGDLYQFITQPELLPLLRTVLFSDRTIDRDGVLIDLIREIGKPLIANDTDTEEWVRDGIVSKIGNAMQSIEDVRQQLVKTLTTEPTKKLFEASIQKFIKESGDKFGIHSAEHVIAELNRYAALCKARACVRGDDQKSYDEIFREKSALNGLFAGENGILESMRQVGRVSSIEVQEMRSIFKRGIRLMERTAYTRIPCNETAPEIWIPNLTASAEQSNPMESYLNERFIVDKDKTRVHKILNARDSLPAEYQPLFLRRQFCSAGWLAADLEELKEKVTKRERSQSQPRI